MIEIGVGDQYEFIVRTLDGLNSLRDTLADLGDQGYYMVGYSNSGNFHQIIMQRKK